MIKVHSRTLYVSGTMADALFTMISIEQRVKLVYVGKKKSQDNEREYKAFELYTEEEVALKAYA